MARRPHLPVDPASSETSRLVDLVRSTVPPMHPAGLPFVAAGLGLAAVGRRRRWLRSTGLAAAGACALFFRHPPRTPPSRPGVVVAPADGRITLIDRELPPPELGMPAVAMTRISIFLSLFDVHVQRVPAGGDVVAVVHRPGEFGSADRQRASTDNERNSMWIRTPDGMDIAVVQIAGVLARRIVCDATAGDTLALGDTYGLIRFGSRLDTYVLEGATVLVESDQRAVGGETVLVELPR